LYDTATGGRIGIGRLRRSLAGVPLPQAADGRLMLAMDVSNRRRPSAAAVTAASIALWLTRRQMVDRQLIGCPGAWSLALQAGRGS
jgi:hypothetical protein